jgi:DNA-binding NarL/FixJ family response regulator
LRKFRWDNDMRVLLAEDHQIVRQGVRSLLEKAGHEVVGEASDGQEAVQLARTLSPDIAVLDVAMPRMNGLDTAREIRSLSPRTKTILLTMYTDKAYILEAIKIGAKGYVVKTEAADDLIRAIREISRGEIYMSPSIANSFVGAYLDDSQLPADSLTRRERQVLHLIAEGNTTKEIAHQLNISFKTAESHRSHLMRKLDLHDIAGLVRYAIQKGIIRT